MERANEGKNTPFSLRRAVEAFLQAEAGEGKSSLTVRNYRADLSALLRAAGDVVTPDRFARAARRHLEDLEVAGRSWNRHLGTIRRLCDFLVRSGAIESNPVADLAPQRVTQAPPEAARPADVRRLLDRIDDLRDRALVALLWHCGLRIGEALQLRVSDVDTNAGWVIVSSRARERRLEVPSAIRSTLASYVEHRLRQGDGPLFVGYGSRPLSYAGAHRLFRRYAGDSGLTMRTLRAGAAAAALRSGSTLRRVQAMLGHLRAASTIRYHEDAFDEDEFP